jgi:hypothetical protein
MDFEVDLNLNSSFLDVLFFGGVRPTCVFRESASNIREWRKSVGFEVSRLERISTRFGESVTLAFAWDARSHFQSRDEGEVTGSTAVWIGAGISLAALLILVVVIILLLGCRPWALKPATDGTESDMETNIPADGEVSSTAVDLFLSEENALSVDRKIPGVLAEDLSEGAVKSPHNREADDSEKRT